MWIWVLGEHTAIERSRQPPSIGELRLLKAKRGWGQVNITLPSRAGSGQHWDCLFWSSALIMFPEERVKSTSTGQGLACHSVVPTHKRGRVEPLGAMNTMVAKGFLVPCR